MTVAALYIDPRGPYPKLLGPDLCWDEQRDARTYAGPWPVVAHPPCGPWSRLRFMCKHQDPTCGPRAVEQVRAFCGVLEHPAESTLFRHCRMPFPGELADEFGGFTVLVRQVAWGNVCEKPTWLYVVGATRSLVASGVRRGGATHSPCHQRTAWSAAADCTQEPESPNPRRLRRVADIAGRAGGQKGGG